MSLNTSATDYAEYLEFVSFSVNTGTSNAPVALSTSSSPLMAVSFTVSADNANTGDVYVGSSGLTSAINGLILDAGETHSYDALQFYSGGAGTAKYNLNRIYALGSLFGTSTVAQLLHVNAVIRRRDAADYTNQRA